MNHLRRWIRFSLGSILLVIAFIGCYVAWLQHDPERKIVAMLEKSGGRVHYEDSYLNLSFSFVSVGMMSDFEYFGQVRVLQRDIPAIPRPTPTDRLLGRLGRQWHRRLAAVEFNLDQLTPLIVNELKRMGSLRAVVVHMPSGMLPKNSKEVQTLDEIKTSLDGKTYASFIQ